MILDIKALADSITQDIGIKVATLDKKPQLTIVMVGNNSASEVYVRNKIKMCEKVGITGVLKNELETITETSLIDLIQALNDDENVTGILVQSPLPSHIDAQRIFDTIDPLKDVDGFSQTNIAKLYSGDETGLMPGTPKWVMRIIENYYKEKNKAPLRKGGESENKIGGFGGLSWKHAVVIGKSTIVGKPLAMMLLHAGATATICHSRTDDLALHTKQADIVISAVGKKHLINAEMIRHDALVIDVGINVVEEDEKRKLFGDCDTDGIAKIADVTPVPGGVGPMTIAMLLSNVLLAHNLQ